MTEYNDIAMSYYSNYIVYRVFTLVAIFAQILHKLNWMFTFQISRIHPF